MESKAIGSEFDRAVINKKVREGLPFTDRYHNRFHLEMPFGLINDPNGLVRQDGITHIFYQWNPLGVEHKHKSWAHTTTRDFVHYTVPELAMWPSDAHDKDGCYSGCGFVSGGALRIFYTCNAKDENGAWRNTEAGRLALVPGAPADLSRAIAYNRDVYGAWGRLGEFVRTGRPVERPELHLGNDAARTRTFAASMRGRAMAIGRGVVPMVDLKGRTRLLDLAGGPGAYAELLVRANPGLTAVTVDLPAISDAAADFVAQDGLSDRIECRHGDYHTDEYEPEGYDAVTIFGALHQESPEDAVAILGRAFRALRPGGAVYLSKNGSSDATFDKDGNKEISITNCKATMSGSRITIKFKINNGGGNYVSISDVFEVSGTAQQMKWTLVSSETVTNSSGATTDTSMSAALQSLFTVATNEMTFVPY